MQQSFADGRISKDDFIAQANLLHQSLWNYIPHLSRSEVREIGLSRDGVQFLMGEEGVRLWALEGESRAAPLEAMNFRAYEPQETLVMNVLAADARCILDIGANIGYHALRLAIREPQARVHAFEPLPSTMEILQRNVALNSLGDRVRVYNHGLSNMNGSCDFFIAPEHGVNASLMNVAGRPNAKRVVSTILKLDEWTTNQAAKPDYIKIDVEGAELLVLQGGQETLAEHRPRVFAELLRKWSAPFGYHPNDVLDLMSSLGYGCWGVGPMGVRRILEVTESTEETNYAFLHLTDHSKTIDLLASE
ncbi:MAG: FkbM family methyltransferase [Cyanobacteriota bacterium]